MAKKSKYKYRYDYLTKKEKEEELKLHNKLANSRVKTEMLLEEGDDYSRKLKARRSVEKVAPKLAALRKRLNAVKVKNKKGKKKNWVSKLKSNVKKELVKKKVKKKLVTSRTKAISRGLRSAGISDKTIDRMRNRRQ